MHTEVTTVIPAPPEVVWAVLSDVARWPEWTASMTSVDIDGPLAPGATVNIRQPKLPATTWTVTDVVDGKSFSWRAIAPGSTAVGEHDVISRGDGTCQVRLALDQTGPLGSLFGLLYRRLTRRYVQMEADGLARRALSGSP